MKKASVLFFILFFVLTVLMGCQQSGTTNEKRQLNFSLTQHQEKNGIYIKDGATFHKFSFVFKNNEKFGLDCNFFYEVKNGTESKKQIGRAGFIERNSLKMISVNMNLFDGRSELRVIPECKSVQS